VQNSVSSLEHYQLYPRDSPRAKKIDLALVEMVALDVKPMSVVEDIGFMKLLYILNLRYQPPSRKTVSFHKSMVI